MAGGESRHTDIQAYRKAARPRQLGVTTVPDRLFAAACAALLLMLAVPSPARAGDDPLESLNRTIFAMNRGLQTGVVGPATSFYESRFSPAARQGISNILTNLREPLTAVASTLSGDLRNAGVASLRFAINTTAGIGGYYDAAGAMGLYDRRVDLGQVLCAYGVPEGPYLMVPVLGPSDLRDLTGDVTAVVSGVSLLGDGVVAYVAADGVNTALNSGGDLRRLEETSLDSYTALRSVYLQKRQSACTATAVAAVAAAPPSDETAP
jgi:phospholipid-binding lipoprotein MlaA